MAYAVWRPGPPPFDSQGKRKVGPTVFQTPQSKTRGSGDGSEGGERASEGGRSTRLLEAGATTLYAGLGN
jgi:hypothetical protein